MLWTCVLLFALPFQDGPKPLPELQSFMAEVRKKMHWDTVLLSQYTYTEKRTSIQVDSKGKPNKTEINIFEVFPGSERGVHRRQIVKNGVRLTEKELEKQDREHQKRSPTSVEEREKIRAERLRVEQTFIDDIFGLYEMEIIRRENMGDHPTILVAFKPRPNYKPKTREVRNWRYFTGRGWFSERDHELARLEVEALEPQP